MHVGKSGSQCHAQTLRPIITIRFIISSSLRVKAVRWMQEQSESQCHTQVLCTIITIPLIFIILSKS